MPKNDFQKLVKKVSDAYDTDIIIYIGPVDRPFTDTLFDNR